MPDISPTDPFCHTKGVAVWAPPVGVNPTPVSNAGGAHDQRIPIPLSDRVAEPRGLGPLWERTAVHENLPDHRTRVEVIEHRHDRRRLEQFEPGAHIDTRNA